MSETKTKNLCTVPAADLTDSQYFIAEDGGELKRIPKAQVVLKKLEKMLATDTENLAGGGEVTAQELLDALAEQVANKLLAKSQVVNNLLATVEGNPLDATQGKALKELIDTTNNNLSNISNRFYVRTSETDFNNMTRSGYFFGKLVQNTPDGTTDSNWIVEVQAFDNSTGWTFQRAARSSDKAIFTRIQDNGTWSDWEVLARKSDLFGHTIYVAGDGGTQNFNIVNNGFLFIPYTSTTCGIYYLGIDSAKLILGTEDSDFKVSISGTTCMLQNNKGWNIFCVFIAGK